MNAHRPALLALIGLASLAPALRAADDAWFKPITLERVIVLPAAEQRPWLEYLERSKKLFAEEKLFRDAEARAAGLGETAQFFTT